MGAVNSNYLTKWEAEGIQFAIREAAEADSDKIISVAQEAYFGRPEHCYYRDPAAKSSYGVKDIPRRLKDPQAYTLYVCVKKDKDQESVVGTVYLQFQKTDFKTSEGPKVEVGALAVAPEYQKRFGIAPHLRELVIKVAEAKKVAFLYLYIVDSIGTYNQSGLQEGYKKLGFKVVDHKRSGHMKHERFKSQNNPEGHVPLIVMEKGLTKKAIFNVAYRSLFHSIHHTISKTLTVMKERFQQTFSTPKQAITSIA